MTFVLAVSENQRGEAGWLVPVGYSESGHGAHYTPGIGALRSTDHKRPEAHLVVPAAISENQRGEVLLNHIQDPIHSDDMASSLTTDGLGVAYPLAMRQLPDGSVDLAREMQTLMANGVAGRSASVLTPRLAVRRLTPKECERLMSWPDDWTRYRADGTELADSHRYRMCGNGVVSNCTEWIGNRLP